MYLSLRHTSDLGSFSIGGLQGYQINYSLHQTLPWRFEFKKMIFSGLFKHNLTISTLLNSGNPAVLHSQNLSRKIVITNCTLNIQTCMIHHFNQNLTADAKMYHACLYVNYKMIYDHICTQFWRSVSASGHGNMILNKLPRPTRVRSRRPQCQCML